MPSESAFSTLTRILDDYRSRLSAEAVEALMLCKAWIEFTKVNEHVTQIKYVFPSKGTTNLKSTQDESEAMAWN